MSAVNTSMHPCSDLFRRVKTTGLYHLIVGCPTSSNEAPGPRSNHEIAAGNDAEDPYREVRAQLWASFGDRISGNGVVIASIYHQGRKNGELLVTFEARSRNDSSTRLVAFTCCLPTDELDRISDTLRNRPGEITAVLAIFDYRFRNDLMLPHAPNIISARGVLSLNDAKDGGLVLARYEPYLS